MQWRECEEEGRGGEWWTKKHSAARVMVCLRCLWEGIGAFLPACSIPELTAEPRCNCGYEESAWCRGRLGGVCCYSNTECESSPVQSEGIVGGTLVCKAVALKMGGMHGFISTGRFRSGYSTARSDFRCGCLCFLGLCFLVGKKPYIITVKNISTAALKVNIKCQWPLYFSKYFNGGRRTCLTNGLAKRGLLAKHIFI